jgi:hypothetical protein
MSVFGYAAYCRFCKLVGVFRERMTTPGKYWKTAHTALCKIIRRATGSSRQHASAQFGLADEIICRCFRRGRRPRVASGSRSFFYREKTSCLSQRPLLSKQLSHSSSVRPQHRTRRRARKNRSAAYLLHLGRRSKRCYLLGPLVRRSSAGRKRQVAAPASYNAEFIVPKQSLVACGSLSRLSANTLHESTNGQ